jgi:hypothetical protein
MVAGTRVLVVEGLTVSWPLALAVTAARPARPARPAAEALDVFREYRGGKRRGVEMGMWVKALRDTGSFRGCLVAGARALPLELHFNSRFERVETEALPAMLDLHVGERKAVLQCPGHLQMHG